MSVVIALKHSDSVYMVCDALSTNNVKHYSGKKYGQKIVVLDTIPTVLIGNSGRAINSQLNRMLNDVFKEKDISSDLTYGFMVDSVYPRIIELQNEHRLNVEDKYPNIINGSRLFASKDKLFMISEYNDGAVMEIDNYSAIGNGAPIAIGSLTSTENRIESPQERLIEALRVTSSYDESVAPPYYIFNTQKKEVEMYQPHYEHTIKTFHAKEIK